MSLRRCVVNVATTPAYQRGQHRLLQALYEHSPGTMGHCLLAEPRGCPKHADVPYAFKALALKEAAERADVLLWCDSSVLPIRNLEPVWARIEREGYWLALNGWTNYQWTADSAYRDLFPDEFVSECGDPECECKWYNLESARESNRAIYHAIATTFGINLRTDMGRNFLCEYHRLASQTRAFCGPWINANVPGAPPADGIRCAPCGPADVLGHRHDQTAASVIAWRLGMKLLPCPEIFAYAGHAAVDTILVAEGGF